MSEQKNSTVESHSVLLHAAGAASPVWGDEQDESLRATFRILRKRKWIIIGCTAVGIAIALLLGSIWPRQYLASTLIELNAQSASMQSSSMSSIANALSGSNDLKTELQTAATVMQSPSVALGVIKKLNLQSDRQFLSRGLFGKESKAKPDHSEQIEDVPALRDDLVARFTSGLKVEAITDTRLLTISYTSRDPKLSAQIANAVVDEYKRQYLRSHYNSTQDTSEWLAEQLSGLKSKVQESEKRLADFQRQTGIISVDQMSMGGGGGGKGSSNGKGEFSNPVLEKFSMLNNQLTLAELNRVTKEAIYKLASSQDPAVVSNLGNSPLVLGSDSAVVMQGGGLSTLVVLQQQQNSLRVDLADAITKYGAKNPKRAELTNRISALDAEIKQELKNIAERAKADYDVSRKVEDGVRKQFDEQQQRANRVNDQAMQLTMLRQEAVAQEMLYEDLYTKLQEANIEAGVHASNVTIADFARPPFAPVIPKTRLWLAFGLGAGLFLGLSSSFLWESMDRSVVSSSQVEAITHGVVFGLLPEVSAPGMYGYGYGQKKQRQELEQADPKSLIPWIVTSPSSVISEAIRSLRTSILLLRAEAPPKIISVTSALSSEGKTTVSLNLAAAFAQQGSRVLLIEGDMRKPKYARLSPNAKVDGLSDVLTGRKALSDCVFEYPEQGNLFVLAGGPRPPIPAELLGSARFGELLRQAGGEYDFIIIDTPPAILVTDAVIILPKVDCVLCVVRSGVTTRPLLARVSRLLRCENGPLLGFVLNRVQTASADYSYYYGYNGHSEYYSEENSND